METPQTVCEKWLAFWEANYTVMYHYDLDKTDKQFMGYSHPKTCRFCGKKEPEVTFDKIAHAIPEFTGNRCLFSYYECDECNAFFSIHESHMANYMNLYHTVSKIGGKRGVPSYKIGPLAKSRINNKAYLHIKTYEEEPELVNIDEDNHKIEIKGTRNYIPVSVYKCLVKMALTLLPGNELCHFRKTVEWIRKTEEFIHFRKDNLQLLFNFYPGYNPLGSPQCVLFKRKSNHKDNVPYLCFFLAYGNTTFQLYLPLCDQDPEKTVYTIKPIPTPPNYEGIWGKLRNIDFSSTEKISEDFSIIFSYERLEESPITQEDRERYKKEEEEEERKRQKKIMRRKKQEKGADS